MLGPTLLPLIIAFLMIDSALSAPNPLLPAVVSSSDGSFDDGPSSDAGGWSSTVGIVASVAGNVLISFALNLQRYSHIKIDKEFQQRLAIKRAQAYSDNEHIQMTSQGYGTNAVVERPIMASNGNSATIDAHSANGYEARRSTPSTTSSTRYAVIEEARRQSYLRSSYWWAGILLMILGEAGNFLAYGFAPASVISPLGVVAIISNCLIAPIMLGETLRGRDLMGVLISIIGTVVIVISFHSSEKTIGPDDIFNMIATTTFFIYTAVTTIIIIVLIWMSETCGANSILIDVGLVGLFGREPIFISIIVYHKLTQGESGGYTALCTKGLSSLLSLTLWHIIAFPITYALLIVLILTALMQIRYINRALQRFDSTQVIPTQFVAFTICVIIGSAVVYRDFESATLKEAANFLGGCVLTFFGVYLITSRRTKAPELLDEEAQNANWAAPVVPAYTDEEQPIVHERPAPAESGASPAHSLLDIDDVSEGEEVGSMTPPARSPLASISEVSSLLASGTTTGSSTRMQSRSRSPFGEGYATIETGPTSPVLPIRVNAQEIQLRFPSAPCVGADLQTHLNQESGTTTGPTAAQHSEDQVPSTSSREIGFGSLPTSVFFTPGPFLAPISGGITAILAECLNRNDPDYRDYVRSYTGHDSRLSGRWDMSQSHHSQKTDQGNMRNGPRRSRADTVTPSSRPRACLHVRRGSNANANSDSTGGEPRLPSRIRSFSDSLSGKLAWINPAVWGKHRDCASPDQNA